jgi:glyoxylase-like metal-dependent hydrolase (beta-lactamase superfamily II)
VPGHSPGSICLLGDGVLICGDVLFRGSIGRTDIPGGSLPQLLAGIRAKLMPLPDETRVLPGHGPETTIGYERRTNSFVGG